MRSHRAPRIKLGHYPIEAALDRDQTHGRLATLGDEDFAALLDLVQQGGEPVLGLENTEDAHGGDYLARFPASLCQPLFALTILTAVAFTERSVSALRHCAARWRMTLRSCAPRTPSGNGQSK